jgi:hypothetical protein
MDSSSSSTHMMEATLSNSKIIIYKLNFRNNYGAYDASGSQSNSAQQQRRNLFEEEVEIDTGAQIPLDY